MIGVIGDLHFRDFLSYADFVPDKRVAERARVLDFIVESLKDCDNIVFMGDCFHTKNPTAKTVKDFVTFLESFGQKQLYIMSGNHCKQGDGSTALDFIGEIKNKPNWHLWTKPGMAEMVMEPAKEPFGDNIMECSMVPYMMKAELGTDTDEASVKELLDHRIGFGRDIIFVHNAISDTTFNGISTNDLKEVVLPKYELESRCKLLVAGHIHASGKFGKTLLTGSVFTDQVGDVDKYIWKIGSDFKVEQIRIPQRGIFKLIDPTIDEVTKLPKDSIVRVVLTDKSIDADALRVVLDGLDGYSLFYQYPSERKRVGIKEGSLDFSIPSLLKIYSEAKKVDENLLKEGLELIK